MEPSGVSELQTRCITGTCCYSLFVPPLPKGGHCFAFRPSFHTPLSKLVFRNFYSFRDPRLAVGKQGMKMNDG